MPAALAFNPFDEATRRNPFPLYARARRECPVLVHEDFPVVSVFRYADVQAILKDPATWSNEFQLPEGLREELPPSMLGSDPPSHTRLRALVSQAFTPRMIKRLEPRVEAIAEELVGAAVARRRVDLVEALTYPLPVVVIAEIIGIPAEDREALKRWSDALVANLGLGFFVPMDEARFARQRRLINEMRDYFVPLVAERRAAPRDDLLSGLVAAELEGSRLSFDEMLQMLILILVAGNETTTTLIGNAVLTLLEHPEALALLRARPELVPDAVEEVLRYSSPIQMDPRRATRAVTLGEVPIAPGQVVLSWLGSANRDEAVFARPEVFDPTRQDNRHLAFGFGPHYCLGASLAGLEATVALRVLLARTRDFRRQDAEPLPLHASYVFNGVTRLPIELEPAA